MGWSIFASIVQAIGSIVLCIITWLYVRKTQVMARTMKESSEEIRRREKIRVVILDVFLRNRANQTVKSLAEKTGKTPDEIILELPYLLEPQGPLGVWARHPESDELYFRIKTEFKA